jgi:hypothetical protein
MREMLGDVEGVALERAVVAAQGLGRDSTTDYRAALCRWEDDLFAEFTAGHQLLELDAAQELIRNVFRVCQRPTPSLRLVPGFDDPSVGGYADIARNCIVIEQGFLYRYLILHESAHILVPHDRCHGPAFTYTLQLLYRHFIGIPESAIRRHLRRHGLPTRTSIPTRELV